MWFVDTVPLKGLIGRILSYFCHIFNILDSPLVPYNDSLSLAISWHHDFATSSHLSLWRLLLAINNNNNNNDGVVDNASCAYVFACDDYIWFVNTVCMLPLLLFNERSSASIFVARLVLANVFCEGSPAEWRTAEWHLAWCFALCITDLWMTRVKYSNYYYYSHYYSHYYYYYSHYYYYYLLLLLIEPLLYS